MNGRGSRPKSREDELALCAGFSKLVLDWNQPALVIVVFTKQQQKAKHMPNARQVTYRPLMSPAEFSQLMTAIWATRPRRFLEWGSGGSTQTILAQCPFIERYVSPEHDPGWYARVKQACDDPRPGIHLVEATRPGPPRGILNATKPRRNRYRLESETDQSLFAAYAKFPRSLGETCDFVLVDGRARRFCMPVGFEL